MTTGPASSYFWSSANLAGSPWAAISSICSSNVASCIPRVNPAYHSTTRAPGDALAIGQRIGAGSRGARFEV